MTHAGRTQRIRMASIAAIGLITVAIVAGGAPAAARVSTAARQTLIPTPTISVKLALFRAGRFVGMLTRLGGCGVGAIVAGRSAWDDTDVRLGAQTSTPCVLIHPVLGRGYMSWLDGSLNGSARPTNLQIASYTSAGAPASAIELRGARLTSLRLPPLNAGSTEPALIASTVVADEIASIPAIAFPSQGSSLNAPIRQDLFTVEVEGTGQPQIRTVGDLEAEALFGDGIRDPRDPDAVAGVFHASELELSVGKSSVRYFSAWLDELRHGDAEPERSMTITYLDRGLHPILVVGLRGVGISGADPGLDPAKRAFGFYVEHLSVSVPS